MAHAASNFSPFPFPVAVKTVLLPKSHPLHCDRCKVRRLPKIRNIRIFVPDFETGDEERVVLQNSCEGCILPILILLQPAPETKENESLVCWTLAAPSHWFQCEGGEKTPNHESRKLLLQVFASANQSCSSSFFFHSARKVAKNKLTLVFVGQQLNIQALLQALSETFFFFLTIALELISTKCVLGWRLAS